MVWQERVKRFHGVGAAYEILVLRTPVRFWVGPFLCRLGVGCGLWHGNGLYWMKSHMLTLMSGRHHRKASGTITSKQASSGVTHSRSHSTASCLSDLGHHHRGIVALLCSAHVSFLSKREWSNQTNKESVSLESSIIVLSCLVLS